MTAYWQNVCRMMSVPFLSIQMFGRAGRNGCNSRAHLVYTNEQLKGVKDPFLSRYCTDQENCLRAILLEGIGSKEKGHRDTACCDRCNWCLIPYARLDMLAPTPPARKKRSVCLREIDSTLKKKLKVELLAERERILQEIPEYQMLGANFLCSKSVIEELCDKAAFIRTKEDLDDIFCLRPELRLRFYNTIWNLVSSAPLPCKRRRM